MRRHFTSFFCNVAFLSAATLACAEEVTLEHNGLTLLADFMEAEDAFGPVALITHGTLAHKDMELVEALQESLAEQGVSSLAHTLSLNVDARRGMYDCERTHTHLDEDADAEIVSWLEWLGEKGHEQVALVGHSRGGKQVARAAASRDDLSAVVLIAPATKASAERSYKRSPTLEGTVIEKGDLTYVETPSFIYCGPTEATYESHASYHPETAYGAETFTPEIDAPILVVAGSKDTVVPEVPATFLPMRSDTLRFALIEDADHMFLDFFAEDAATAIAEFLADLPAVEPEEDFETANQGLYDDADLAYGEYLGSECASCHHVDASEGVPPITGLEAWYTHLALIQYANGERENAAMRLVARSLDDEQRIAVAAYFASQETD